MWQIENNFKTEEEFGIWDDSWTSAYFPATAIRHKNYTIFLSKTRQKCEQSWTVLQDFLGRHISLGHCMGIYDVRFEIVLRPLPDLPHLTGFCLSWIMHWIDFCRLSGINRGRSHIIFSNPRCHMKYSARWYHFLRIYNNWRTNFFYAINCLPHEMSVLFFPIPMYAKRKVNGS